MNRAGPPAGTSVPFGRHCTHLRVSFCYVFLRMGRLENASVEAQSMLAGLESQLGTNHEATMSALYLAGSQAPAASHGRKSQLDFQQKNANI